MADFAKMVHERLRFTGVDIGFKRAWDYAPARKITRVDMPSCYSITGATFSPTINSNGLVKESRAYVQRFLLMPFAGGIADHVAGNEASQMADEWINKIIFYYMERQLLSTSTLAPLQYCKGVLSSSDPGFVTRRAPGGLLCAAIDLTLNVTMEARAEKRRIPYEDET